MKIEASKYPVLEGVIRLTCTSWRGRITTVYAHYDGFEWRLSSGRRPSRKMLDAIDRIPMTIQPRKAK